MIANYQQPANLWPGYPGLTVAINGALPDEVRTLEDLDYQPKSDHLTLIFEEIHSGYWLGGKMWRGTLRVGPQAPPGTYTLTVKGKEAPVGATALAYQVQVYPDAAAYAGSTPSLFRRFLGLSPWLLAAMCAPFILASFGAAYLSYRRLELKMARSGRAEVYLVRPNEGGLEVAFGLGSNHGIQVGTQLTLLTPEGQVVGMVEVHLVRETDALGLVRSGERVKAGYIVSRQT